MLSTVYISSRDWLSVTFIAKNMTVHELGWWVFSYFVILQLVIVNSASYLNIPSVAICPLCIIRPWWTYWLYWLRRLSYSNWNSGYYVLDWERDRKSKNALKEMQLIVCSDFPTNQCKTYVTDIRILIILFQRIFIEKLQNVVI